MKIELENLKELLRAMQDYDNLQNFLEHVALATSIDQEWEGAKINLHDYACGKRFRV